MQLFSRNKALIALSLGALAALGACGDDVTVTQPAATPVSVIISPPSQSMNVGESVNFAVQITGGSATTPPTLSTCVSSTPAVATAAVSGTACRATAVAAGNATITATASTGQSAAASVSVAAPAAAISGLSVTPASSSVPVGQTVTLTPTVQRANPSVTVAYAYTASPATVATVNATTGVVTAVAPGIATIQVTATGTGTGFASATLTSSALVTVTALPSGLTSIAVQPTAVSIQQGRTAQLTPSAQQPQGAPAVTYAYTSNTATVATVNATTGLVSAVAPGTAVITVTGSTAASPSFAASTQSALVTVTVTALPSGINSVSAQPASLTIAPSNTAQIQASAAQPQGAEAATFSYGSNAPLVATVSNSGVITALTAGSAVITVTASSAANANFAAASVTALVSVTVSAQPSGLTSISAQPSALSIQQGRSAQLTPTAQQPQGAPAVSYTYASNTQSVATVSATGAISAVAPGTAVITVTGSTAATPAFAASTQTALVTVTVTALPSGITSLSAQPSTVGLAPSRTAQITPNVAQPAGASAATFAYSTNAPLVATVSNTGVITAVAAGSAVITVTANSAASDSFAAASVTALVAVTVSDLQDGITAFVVQPNTLDPMALGSTAQLTNAVQQPTGAATASISYMSSAPAIASVSSTGLVTALSSGVANITVTATSAAQGVFGLTTRTQVVRVNVGQSANVTIQTITQGPQVTAYSTSSGSEGLVTSANSQVNQPIDINNVRDQIQVTVNLQPFGQRVDSVVVFINDAAPGSTKRAAARQLYSNGVANASDITLFVNTADFTANFTTGASDVFYRNGQKVISASVFTTSANGTASEIQNAENNRQIVNFNNLDGYAARYGSPTRSIVGTNNFTWWGGPDAAGQGSYNIVPVFYSAGRTITRIDIGMRQGLPTATSSLICDQGSQAVRFFDATAIQTGTGTSLERYTALPFNGTYNANIGRMTLGTGSSTSFVTATNGNIECRGYVHPNSGTASNFVSVEVGTDNFNNPAPVVTRFDGYRTSAQVLAIVPNRLDYAGPETVEPDIRRTAPTTGSDNASNAIWTAPAVTGWVNAPFNFQSQTVASVETNGVGLPTTSSRQWRFLGCNAGAGGTLPSTDTLSAPMPNATGADIPECSVDNQGGNNLAATASTFYGIRTRGPYRATYVETDLLSNASNAPISQRFGVDKTNPLIRLSTATAADTANGTATRSIQAEVLDERAGFIDNNDLNAVLRRSGGLTTDTLHLIPTNFGSFQHYATRGASSSNPTTLQRTSANNINCINPNSLTGMSSSTSNPFGTGTTSASGGTTPITAPSCPFINQGNNGTTIGIFGALPDGYRQATAVSFSSDGIYTYRGRVFDRAGNVSTVIARSYAVENTNPTISDLNVPGSIVSTATPTFGTVASASAELRAYNLSIAQPGIANRLIYPQTLLNARFDDVIGSQYSSTLALPTPAPFITAMETTTGAVPNTGSSTTPLANVTNINASVFNTANVSGASGTLTTPVGFSAVALSTLTGITNANGAALSPNYTLWSVLSQISDLQPGFNAPQGLKAQLRGNTNVPNPPFTRVEFFRLNSTSGNYEYLGSATTSAQADQGVIRFWTWTLTSDLYARTPTDLSTTQPQVALNDVVLAIGVRSNGAGFSTTPAGTTIGGAAINFFGTVRTETSLGNCTAQTTSAICFVAPPTGFPQITTAAPNLTVSTVTAAAPQTFTGATVTAAGILPVDANGGTYAVTPNSVVINGVTYVPSITVGTTFQNVVVAASTVTNLPFRIIYQPVLLGLNVTTNLPSLATPLNVTLTGTAGAATGITVGPVLITTSGQLIPVPASGTYALTLNSPASITIGNQLYNGAVVGAPVVVGGAVPSIAVTYALPVFPFTSSFNVAAGAPYTAETFTAGSISIPQSVGFGGTITSTNPLAIAFGAFVPAGAVQNVTANFGTNANASMPLTIGTVTGTYTASLTNGAFSAIPVALSPQATLFGPVVSGTSSFNPLAAGAQVLMWPASISITVTGTASVVSGTNPANWVLPATTLTGPNSYTANFTGGAGPAYTGFQLLQVGSAARNVIVPIASPGVGSYQLSVPNQQTIGGTNFTVNGCAAGNAALFGTAVQSVQVVGANCLIAINATYSSTAAAVTINYTAP